ncbi:ABC transporter permease [Paludicola sp. MB14-C6]|uniref:ABC transporter permease n=1 Tax=Paludihabitans sp. MB14-C6 TaxID=3070656 RepID=UPI0027DB39A5|nr:ABC transporter permease [Paludicola sp. MB14-C6]WMJ23540.1 ABC transporter permease [Paludicola sp. MB14-C6]
MAKNSLSEKKENPLAIVSRIFLQKQESSIILALIFYIIFVTCINPTFASKENIFNVLHSSGFALISIAGTTLTLLTGGLDLSVGSVLALGGVVTGLSCKMGLPVPIAIILGVLSGVLVGAVNGFIIVKANIPPLIVTLGMQYAARGLVSVLTQGVPIYPLPKELMNIEKTSLFGIPMIVIASIAVAILFHVILTHTGFGRSVYALGGNEEAARISGINTKKTKFLVYVISSTLAALAGVFMAARLGSAEAAAGTGYEMTVICGAIIGGTSALGGMGTIFGAVLGGLFMEILTNSLTLMRISVYWQQLVVGAILILAVMLDQYKRKLILKNSIKSTK